MERKKKDAVDIARRKWHVTQNARFLDIASEIGQPPAGARGVLQDFGGYVLRRASQQLPTRCTGRRLRRYERAGNKETQLPALNYTITQLPALKLCQNCFSSTQHSFITNLDEVKFSFQLAFNGVGTCMFRVAETLLDASSHLKG